MPDISVRPVRVLISLSCQSVPARPAAAERLPAVICRPAPSAPPVPDPVQTKGFHPVHGQTLARGRCRAERSPMTTAQGFPITR